MSIESRIIDLRVASKLFIHEARMREKEINAAEYTASVCLRRGDEAEACIHVEEAVRCKNERSEFKRLAARLNATASQLSTAQRMHKVTRTMDKTVRLMVQAGKQLDVAKVSRLMERYEKESVNIKLKQNAVSTSMQSSVSPLVPQDEVSNMLSKLADKAGLELSEQFSSHRVPVTTEEGDAEALPSTSKVVPKRVAVALGTSRDFPPKKQKKQKKKKKNKEEEEEEEEQKQEEPELELEPEEPILVQPPPRVLSVRKPVAHIDPALFTVDGNGDLDLDVAVDGGVQKVDRTPVLEPERLPQGPLIDFGDAINFRSQPVIRPPLPIQQVECRPMVPIYTAATSPESRPRLVSLLDESLPEVSLEVRLAALMGTAHP